MTTLEGRRIGAYQLATRIGVGGMGEVYKARDMTLNRQVAIKVLLPAVARYRNHELQGTRERVFTSLPSGSQKKLTERLSLAPDGKSVL
jgi:serine/threonine protein kinase